MPPFTILRHQQVEIGIHVNGDHQRHSLGDVQVDLTWDEDSQYLTLGLSPWAAEKLMVELMAKLPNFHNDKG